VSDFREPTAIAWMARNPVAANLCMLILLVGGLLVLLFGVRQEVFPAFEVDAVRIAVPYPGASPEEVETGIILAVEEAVQGLDGVDRIQSTASEGLGVVMVELRSDADADDVQADIKNQIDRIVSFPEDAERPTVSIPTTRREVMSLVLYGDVDEKALRELAESVRDDLLRDGDIAQVELAGVREPQIAVEVPQSNLRAHNLTLEEIARQVARSAVELPGGGVRTPGGEILLRTDERRDLGREFETVAAIATPDGTERKLSDIATVIDGFDETDVASFYDGMPAVLVNVFRTGSQTPIEVSAAVREYRETLDRNLPPGVKTAIWGDRSEIFADRVGLLRRNALYGLFLVLGILGLFLELRLAFWVTMGIPISFLGSFLFLPAADVSINMISLFAFIITLGMVVDDAIVVGENIHVHRQRADGTPESFVSAAIRGASEVVTPVTFSILTSITAFAPMFFVEGTWGKIFRFFPAVIILVLLLSLFESIFILPAHLGHLGPEGRGRFGRVGRLQRRFGRRMERFSENVYGRMVRWCVRNRWITWAIGVAVLTVAVGVVRGGRVSIVLFPKVESDWVVAEVALPFGVARAETDRVRNRLERAYLGVVDELTGGDPETLSRGLFARIDGTHKLTLIGVLVAMDRREISATEFTNRWRAAAGTLPGVESIAFDATAGGPRGGKAVDVQLSHRDIDTLERAASRLAEKLTSFAGVIDIDDGVSEGKPQLNFRVRPEARSLGITAAELGRQTRHAFWGVEALRQQRGRDTVRVMVRLPASERKSEHDIRSLLIRTSDGGEIPLFQAAEVERGRSYTTIRRTDGRRTIGVTADVDEKATTGAEVLAALREGELPQLVRDFPGLSFDFEGEARQGRESMVGLFKGFAVALLVMYVLIAIPFKSYVQPLIVLSAIPFGLVGAVIGHMVMGYSLSLISMMGLLALSGVVVNDSLVLVHRANEYRDQYDDVRDAVADAGVSRFRPILLTSLTTFLGLTPMIFETSLQARFLIPMAISLGFGVLFATFIILLMVPAFYIIVEDLWDIFGEIRRDIGAIARLRPGRKSESGSPPDTASPRPPETPDYPVTPGTRREGGGPRS
jgi:multidrug efflux pump subunit AcrB